MLHLTAPCPMSRASRCARTIASRACSVNASNTPKRHASRRHRDQCRSVGVYVTRTPTTALTETAGIHEARAASAGREPSIVNVLDRQQIQRRCRWSINWEGRGFDG